MAATGTVSAYGPWLLEKLEDAITCTGNTSLTRKRKTQPNQHSAPHPHGKESAFSNFSSEILSNHLLRSLRGASAHDASTRGRLAGAVERRLSTDKKHPMQSQVKIVLIIFYYKERSGPQRKERKQSRRKVLWGRPLPPKCVRDLQVRCEAAV